MYPLLRFLLSITIFFTLTPAFWNGQPATGGVLTYHALPTELCDGAALKELHSRIAHCGPSIPSPDCSIRDRGYSATTYNSSTIYVASSSAQESECIDDAAEDWLDSVLILEQALSKRQSGLFAFDVGSAISRYVAQRLEAARQRSDPLREGVILSDFSTQIQVTENALTTVPSVLNTQPDWSSRATRNGIAELMRVNVEDGTFTERDFVSTTRIGRFQYRLGVTVFNRESVGGFGLFLRGFGAAYQSLAYSMVESANVGGVRAGQG
jgi:hypothetical protein